MRTVYIYGIFFAACMYCYIGSSIHPYARYEEHKSELADARNDLFKHRVWRKHGVAKFVVFKRTTDEAGRIALEQEYYDFFARHGYILVNACRPDQSRCNDHSFVARQEYHDMISAAQTARYQRPDQRQQIRDIHAKPEYRDKVRQSNLIAWSNPTLLKRHSICMHELASTDERRAKQSRISKEVWQRPGHKERMSQIMSAAFDDNKRAFYSDMLIQRWQTDEYRQFMSSYDVRMSLSDAQARYLSTEEHRQSRVQHLLTDAMNEKRKAAYATDAYKQKRAACSLFNRTYGTTKVFHYKRQTGDFTPAMHFFIKDGLATVFIWDTRKIVMTCDANALPAGYIRAFDNYQLLTA